MTTGRHNHQGVQETPKKANVICEQPHQSVSVEEEAKKKNRRVAKRHNLCAPLARANWSNSTCGMATGSICLLVTVLVLVIFTTADTKEAGRDLEYGGKVLLTLYCTVLYCTALH